MSRFLIPLVAITLAGCSSMGTPPEPEIQIQKVVVEKPVSCVPNNVGPPPAYPDTDEALLGAADASVRYMLMSAGRLLRVARLGEVEPVVETCRGAADE